MKGISPLIATIILIALTIAIAGVLGLWAASYVSTRTQEVNKTAELIDCQLANFEIISCKKENNKIKMILFNDRRMDLNGFRVTFMKQDENGNIVEINATEVPIKLKAAGYETLETNVLLSDYSKIEVRSLQCPNVFKEKSSSEC